MAGTASTGTSHRWDASAAGRVAFLGGAATAGGKGTIVGTFLAVILVGVLNNGMNLLGFNTFVQRVALGLLLIAAVPSSLLGISTKAKPRGRPVSRSLL